MWCARPNYISGETADGAAQAFCSISTGIYGYPIDDATHIALDTVRTFLETDAAAKVTLLPSSWSIGSQGSF
jgi:O-acetyl-ADP-ribose deacetylase (regulator of RNase III)